MLGVFWVKYVIRVTSQIGTRFSMNNNYCTMPHEQELIKDNLVLRPAPFRDQGKNSAEENRGPSLYSRKYGMLQFFVPKFLSIKIDNVNHPQILGDCSL